MDVHKKTVVACLRTDAGQETRTFGTMTRELLRLWDWLDQEHVSAVAMESTGVYWKPVFNVLESLEVELMVVNAKHVKAVPGRKTDVKDAEWLADLLRHGLLKASFIPPRPHRELRELARYRRTLIDERSDVVRRIQKLLEGANIKLGDVVTDVVGVSGRAILWALAEGQTDPDQLSQLAKTSLRRKRAELTLALEGSMGDHQRFMLRRQLLHVDFLEGQIEDLCREIEERMRPFQTAIQRIDEIRGLGQRSAEVIVAEIGVDMSRFPSAKHLSSWVKICPGNHQSAGKRRSGATGKGNVWLQTALVEAAWSASNQKGTYYHALYRRLAARRGPKRAIVAVAHALLTAIYYMLRDGVVHRDLGPDHFDRLNREAVISRNVRRLEKLCYHVSLQPIAS
jgi:transposase